MSKCYFIVIKKKTQQTNPQTKSTPDQNTPGPLPVRCKQTQVQDQPFSVAVVADGSHGSISPPGGGWWEWVPRGAGGRWLCT